MPRTRTLKTCHNCDTSHQTTGAATVPMIELNPYPYALTYPDLLDLVEPLPKGRGPRPASHHGLIFSSDPRNCNVLPGHRVGHLLPTVTIHGRLFVRVAGRLIEPRRLHAAHETQHLHLLDPQEWAYYRALTSQEQSAYDAASRGVTAYSLGHLLGITTRQATALLRTLATKGLPVDPNAIRTAEAALSAARARGVID